MTVSCKKKEGDSRYEQLKDGVVVHLDNPAENAAALVKLQVVTADIIHVNAVPGDSFPDRQSLMVVKKEREPVHWDLRQENDQLTLQTSHLKAHVDLNTGAITFTDSTGQTILNEQQGGGKTFTPTVIDDSMHTYHVRQVFQSPDDEAFYGLGEHQNGEMNYKGRDVDLTQYNSVAVVPFLVSSRNYGILWDNYSITRFGDPRDFQPLSSLKLYDTSGKEGGLTTSYAQESSPETAVVSRVEPDIAYQFLKDMKKFPEGFPLDNAIVTWKGSMASDTSGEHKFLLHSSGYTKIWVNDSLLVDNWREAWNPTTTKFRVQMEQGKKYPVKIEWIPDGGESYMALKWLSPLSEAEQEQLSLSSEVGDAVDYYFIRGSNLDEVVHGYREITGDAPVMPKWAMGLWQSRERYHTQEEVLSVVKEFRQRNIPLDNIVLDWQYWKPDQWGSHAFDPTRFPDPKGMIDQLHQQYHTHFMISVWPKFYVGTAHYKAFHDKGWLYTKNVENQQKDWIGYVSTFYDAFNPDARKLFWKQMNEALFSKGVDAWWLDATEPDILSNASIEHRKALMNPTALGSSSRYFNAYPLMNAKGIYEGQRAAAPDQRVFILTRSAYAGLQRYSAAVWSGDIAARWDELGRQIPAGLNFSLSGIPFWTTDIGGFFVEDKFEHPTPAQREEWRELMARWFQFGTFCPLLRVHGQYPLREMFNVAPKGHVAYKTIVAFDKLRYRLMPYLYTLAGKAYFDDYTLMRALVMDFPEDRKVYNIGDQYMFGPSLLIAPVYAYKARSRKVYLPAGTDWYGLFTGKYYEGGQTIEADAPVERMPVFVKAGAIMPVGPEIQYAMEKQADPITLYIYTGQSRQFTLYEDEGVNYAYEKGKYATIPFAYDEANHALTIGERKGSYPGMPSTRTFQIVWVTKDKPAGLPGAEQYDQTVEYQGQKLTIKW